MCSENIHTDLIKRLFYIVLLVVVGNISLLATHNRAGEITYSQIDDLTIECVVTTYTKESSTTADRDSILVSWGDGSFSVLFRENGPGKKGESLGNDIKKNVYRGLHTYPGRGTYTIGLQDPNRVADVKNIPNSVNVKFFISTTLTLLNTQFQGFNSSAILLQPPIDVGCIGRIFIHNPNAYDPDGDSLSYELIVPFQGPDTIIPGYTFPDQVLPGPDNVITLNEKTGEFKWVSPQLEGEFNIAIRINEWRNGVKINSIIRDMQIAISNCDNSPPIIQADQEICVVAGTFIQLEIIATDLDSIPDRVRLSATGGAFSVNPSPAAFITSQMFQDSPASGSFEWQTTCEHIRKEPYVIVFKAEDQPILPPTLADLHTLSITIVGPPPLDLDGQAENDSIALTWSAPYVCSNADDNYFYGFSIWRKIGSKDVKLDTCSPGLEGQGYQLIDYQNQMLLNGRYIYKDGTAEKGRTYCYRVLAEFAKTNPSGFPYNFVQSLTSDEVCLQLSRDLPLILNVDVRRTSLNDGSIFIKWTKPLAAELDTVLRPGPYVYTLQRRIRGQGNFVDVPGARFIASSFSSPVDTSYTDSLLNTLELSYEYQVAFTYGGLPTFRVSEDASSIFLLPLNSDRQITLTWTEDVPWDNTEYHIFQRNAADIFDSIGATQDSFFKVEGLINDSIYCFKVLAIGNYGIAELNFDLFNNSQVACGVPIDSVPPCAPDISVNNSCDSNEDIAEDEFYNVISWNDPTFICRGSEDLVRFVVYFRRTIDDNWTAIDTIDYKDGFETVHLPGISAAGCYAVTSVDSVGNESRIDTFACIENCPLYELPNTFTPNGNDQNDLFKPRKKRFIDHVDFMVYNRWGQVVFETNDADINWDGTNMNGTELKEGTYFYKCTVFEREYDGVLERENLLSGYIEIIRSQQ